MLIQLLTIFLIFPTKSATSKVKMTNLNNYQNTFARIHQLSFPTSKRDIIDEFFIFVKRIHRKSHQKCNSECEAAKHRLEHVEEEIDEKIVDSRLFGTRK